MPEIMRRARIGKILTFSIDERVFSELENRFGMITSRIIKGMNFSRWMPTVPFVSRRLSLTAREQAKLNQSFLTLVLEKL